MWTAVCYEQTLQSVSDPSLESAEDHPLLYRLEELMIRDFSMERKGNALFNDALNTFYLRLYGVGHIVKDHSDSERGNPLPPHRLLFSISSKGSFICIIPQTG